MLPNTKQFILVRHATPDVAKGVCYGRLDLKTLDADTQALNTKLLASLPRSATLYASPLQRCAITANALHSAGWPKPIIDERLAEMHFGQWEGKNWSHIERAQINAWADDVVNYCPPGGESVRDVAKRALACVAQMSFEQDTVVITHAGVIQVLKKLLLKQPLENFSASKIDYGTVIRLQRTVDLNGAVSFSEVS